MQAHTRDKNIWRKPQQNVTTSTPENTDTDAKNIRRQSSQDSSSSPLHSIVEEEKRKPNDQSPVEKSSASTNKIPDSPNSDEINKQTIYIRPPFDEGQPMQHAKHNSSIYIRPDSDPLISDNQPNIPKRIRRPYLNETNNKIEIDSDNVETPPVTRKHLHLSHHNSGNSNSKDNNEGSEKQKKDQELFLGDGQFDRFSSARRTRRFKRPIDLSSATEGNTNPSTTSPDSTSEASFSIENPPDSHASSKDNISNSNNSKTTLTKTELVSNDNNSTKEAKNKVNNDVVTRIGKIGKSISRISQEDVREAIRSLKSPTPEREWNIRDSFRTATSNISTNKFTSHELNDEGFEETQSLVSDTPSLTTSSCNEEAKSKKETSPDDNTSSGNPANASPTKRRALKPSSQLQTLLSRNQQSLERSRSLRTTAMTSGTRSASSTPRRTNSLRKPEQPNQLPKPTISSIANKRLDVERSNSRASLRSSRSSLNSAVSTNTVKKMPMKPSIPNSSAAATSKRSLLVPTNPSTVNKSPKTITRVPASRSSSSGSSIGPAIKKPPTPSRISASVSSNFRENQNNRSKVSPASSAASTKTNSSNSMSRTSPSLRATSFMRPTTSSATKVKSK